jgi:hypothetical protein
MKLNINNFFKKIFIYNWNFFSRINFNFYLKKNKTFKKKISNKIKVLIVKPYNYSDLYSPNKKTKLDTIQSSRYRMGPISIILDFNSKLKISEYASENKIKIKNILKKHNYTYYKNQYISKTDLKKINFSKFDWVISIKDSVPSFIIKRFRNVLWTLLFEDHRDINYLRYKVFGSTKYDLTLDTTQGFTPYDLFQNNKSINFPYTFANSSVPKKLGFKNKKKKQILLEIYQPKNLSFKNLNNFKILISDGNSKILSHFKKLSDSKYFYCPIYKLPRWGNSIIEAATFNCLIIGNPNCFWNSLLIQKECIATNHEEGIEIIKKFERNKKFYEEILKQQTYIFNLINYHRPLEIISRSVKQNFPYKKISKFL